jgi:CheY-like chemotaxis protein
MKTARVTLIHWTEAEGLRREAQLREAEFDARLLPPSSPPNVRAIRDDPPDVVIIDLTRLPSHGREVAVMLRQWKTTRHLPLIFAGGSPEKVQLIRERLPDAIYSEWERIRPALKEALRAPVVNPIVPPRLEGYSTSSLPKKLGIKPGRRIALVNAPDGFEECLQPLEQGQLQTGLRGSAGLILLFVESQSQFETNAAKATSVLPEAGTLWIIYPKKSSGVRTDVTENGIREFCIALGLVDYKICAVDETWTGLCFARRKISRS